MKPTKVIFRKWKNGGDIIALFPTAPANTTGGQCLSYMHIGQHGAADPSIVNSVTVPAKPAEYRPLLKELYRIGYRKLVISRRFQKSDTTHRFNLLSGILPK